MIERLAIIDWGVGGLGFYRALRERHLSIPVLYWSDTGSPPYGTLQSKALVMRLRRLLLKISELGAVRAVVACNAASSVLESLKNPVIPVSGVIAPAVRSLLRSRAGVIGIIGGRRTILSGAYKRPLETAGRIVRQRIAQPLSAFVESGEIEGPRLIREIARIVRPLRNPDILVLGCTHYAAIRKHFERALPGTQILDPVKPMLEELRPELNRLQCKKPVPRDIFITTGNPSDMKRSAKIAFGIDELIKGTVYP